MSFQLNTTTAEAIIRINLAKPENIAKFGGRIWHSQKGDGNYAFLGVIQETAGVTIQGHKIESELNEVSVEIRVGEEDILNLLGELEEYTQRVAEVKITLMAEPAMKTLTLKSGQKQNAVVLYGAIAGVRPSSSKLDSDVFTSKDEITNFLAQNRKAREQNLNDSRSGMRMATEANNNILA